MRYYAALPHDRDAMRIDLASNRHRKWQHRIALKVVAQYIGMIPGPMLTMTYRPDLVSPEVRAYMLRSSSNESSWSRGESEVIASFVSDLNTCHFEAVFRVT
jgi:hypothetical protein